MASMKESQTLVPDLAPRDDVTLRPPTVEDGGAMRDLLSRNRKFFAAAESHRAPEYYTRDHQTWVIEQAQIDQAADRRYLWLIEVGGTLVGRLDLNSVIRGTFQSATVGFLVDASACGSGVATTALREAMRLAFTELGLHRLQAETLTDNYAAQRVLVRCGFVRYGRAPCYLRVQGEWRDHDLFQLINTHVPGRSSTQQEGIA